MQVDLGEQCWVYYREGFIDHALADQLFDKFKHGLHWRQDQITLFGKTHPIPRLQAWYGEPYADYSYSGIKLKALPWTPELSLLKERLEESFQVGFQGVLCNFYRTGRDYAAWHADNEVALGPSPVIASLSFGGTRRFDIRHRQSGEKKSWNLTHGSALVMGGRFQECWQHQLARTQRAVEERINLTFRPILIQS